MEPPIVDGVSRSSYTVLVMPMRVRDNAAARPAMPAPIMMHDFAIFCFFDEVRIVLREVRLIYLRMIFG